MTTDQLNVFTAQTIYAEFLANLMAQAVTPYMRFAVIFKETTLGDGSAGHYFWEPTSTDTHDGTSTVKPNSLSASDPGRWKRHT